MSVKSVLLVSLALVLLYSSGSILWSEYEAKQWPQTEAVILSVEAKVKAMEVPFAFIGKVGGDSLIVDINGKEFIREEVSHLKELWFGALETYVG